MKFSSKSILWLVALVSLTSCTTGKIIKDVEDIADDGERNTVLLTYDINILVPTIDNTVTGTTLYVHCPKDGATTGRQCFSIRLPYRGLKQVDGFTVHAFQRSGARPMSMDYGRYTLGAANYNILIDSIPITRCYYDKKSKSTECETQTREVAKRYSSRFLERSSFSVSSGSACYLGHLNLEMRGDNVVTYSLDTAPEIRAERLSQLPEDLSGALMDEVDRLCSDI